MQGTPLHYTCPNCSFMGSSKDDIQDEPDWSNTHNNRIGFPDRNERHPGFTHIGDEWNKEEERQFLAEAKNEADELQKELGNRDLINVRMFMNKQEDYSLRFPQNHPPGWRYMLHTTEDFIKYEQDWPINIKRRQKEQETRDKEQNENENDDRAPQKEHEWRRGCGENETHNDAHAAGNGDNKSQTHEKDENGQKAEQSKYSPQELSLLRMLQAEREYMQSLKENNGTVRSPVAMPEDQDVSIDETDQFTPDNWVPRSAHLIRLTGKHPLNCEPDLSSLWDAGLITPNNVHYVRNHGSVPHILWETHEVDVNNGELVLSMDDIENRFAAINIAVALACDGNRRKELNMIRRSKGFNWGPGAVSCAFWKGPLLRDILLAAGVKKDHGTNCKGVRRWVHFEGADELSEGKYATSIPLAYAMDPENDVILAYEMNNVRLPPDHGYPVRLIIPGYVGGRCVKWIRRIWISEKENDSHYHIWDNRVLPSFIRDMDSDFAHTMFHHTSTACNEQNLNSIIVKPGHGEKVRLVDVGTHQTYRVAGIAYDGGGHEVQRVEVSLDGGVTWLYCIRKFPEYPLRHGNKFWTWLHWYVDVGLTHLIRAESIVVRCFNVFKNTQPERPSWNIMGMMNNSWYAVRPEIRNDGSSGPVLYFRHPCEPGTGTGGWMEPSTENLITSIKHDAGSPKKQFTREDIEKHDKEDDCWVVINGKVFDATSVLDWHPGGKAPIMAHAGKVHNDTTDDFMSIHDDYAEQKLSECTIGVATEKAMGFIKKQAEDMAKERTSRTKESSPAVLERHRWHTVRFIGKKPISDDTHRYSFALPSNTKMLGLETCQHIQLGFHFSDRLVVRPYTPTRPVFEAEEDGTFDLVVKTYAPDKSQPGGTMSNILDCLRLGEEVEVKGPGGEIRYTGHGKFKIDEKEYRFDKISLVLGGSGITPGYQLLTRILRAKEQGQEVDKTAIRVIDANKTQGDILLREELDELAEEHPHQFKITHVLSHPDEHWKGEKGHVSKELLQKYVFGPGKENVALLCGPPTMIQKAVLPALRDMGYDEDHNLFGF